MRLVLVDRLSETRIQFYPLVFGRPLWELRCGMTSLEEKLMARIKPDDVAYFVPEYMADYYKTQTDKPVNDLKAQSFNLVRFHNCNSSCADTPGSFLRSTWRHPADCRNADDCNFPGCG